MALKRVKNGKETYSYRGAKAQDTQRAVRENGHKNVTYGNGTMNGRPLRAK